MTGVNEPDIAVSLRLGTVHLIGAGPGDPGLLTIAGRDALARADVVIYDRLAHPSLLQYAPVTAERVFVGKQSARHFVKQEDTNDLMVRFATEGKTVVRLKGGDPFVFGRGGEEAEYLRERGVPFRIVPGVTSAIAAPAYAGIPVTHRDAASSFAVITGHERDDSRESGTREAGEAEQRRRWDHIAHAADTLVFLMGVESLADNARKLIENGRASETPVAVIQWGTWTKQRVVTGTLADIAGIARDAGITAPAVTVVGDVVRYREAIRWFDSGPLFGKRILVTRAREQASALSEKLRLLGAEPIEFPTIRIEPPTDGYAGLDAAIEAFASGYDWLVFTSANGVVHTFDRLFVRGQDARAFGAMKIAAIGTATADALRERGIVADFVPTEFVAEAVLAQFPEPVAGKRILLARAAEAREVLPDTWREQGATVDVVSAYRGVVATEGAEQIRELMENGEMDIITFSSSSTVRNFVEAMEGTPISEGVILAAIGPVTAETCRELIRTPDCIANEYTMDGLISEIVQLLASRSFRLPDAAKGAATLGT
ncbi:MAG: uroporphyrinogen-III C-methyltransferase [Akkermansiaceae bacterium]|nr:uroporphyrinogen-III C-methyltransferase [Armatimonadota bacterium]